MNYNIPQPPIDDPGRTETASPLVYLLACLPPPPEASLNPQIGDMVVETTHVIRFGRKNLGLLKAVGELVKIEHDAETGWCYTIKNLDGQETRWSNASLRVIYRKTDIYA